MSVPNRKAIVIGVTGGIACGKSEAGLVLGRMGFGVCDADHVAHGLMKRGTPLFRQVVQRFGDRILAEDGEISRPVLGKAVFDNPDLREALDRLVHPAVREVLAQWIGTMRRGGGNAAVLVPLLYESGMDDLDWDAVLCVSSNPQAVLERLATRGLGRGDALRRVDSQMDLKEKEQRADFVVRNNGTLDELEQAVRNAVQALLD